MSVSLALVPVALAVRLVMGEKKFDEWVESMQIKIPSSFTNHLDLTRTVKGAGYDCEPFFGSFKTHTRNEVDWFTWETVDGKWLAVFSRYDPREKIADFMRDLEAKSERKVFQVNRETGRVEVVRTKTFPTNFSDAVLLTEALQSHGAQVTAQPNGDLSAQFGSNAQLNFIAAGEGPFLVEIPTATEEQLAHGLMVQLDASYRGQVQKLTYQNLRERIESSHFSIESEEVLPDKTIVITLNVNG